MDQKLSFALLEDPLDCSGVNGMGEGQRGYTEKRGDYYIVPEMMTWRKIDIFKIILRLRPI